MAEKKRRPIEIADSSIAPVDYERILDTFLQTRGEEALYRASYLSQACIEGGLGPEDIIALHVEALEKALKTFGYREQARAMSDAHQFLLEVMIAYGVKYKEYLELKVRETLRDAEARMARERERAQEAERLRQEKDEILAVIAHELRTPITVARGSLELASRSLSRGQVDSVPRLIGSAREALDRLSRLSADLVEASREGVPALERSKHELASFAKQACNWVRPLAESKRITLIHEECGDSMLVLSNADALLSAFGNLLSNAIRYTPSGGRVTVQEGHDLDYAWVAVVDSGIGMPPEVLTRIFDKFYRGPEARKVEAKGLGLGLALVKQIVDAHGGKIEVESTPGQGSSFRVILPIVKLDEESPSSTPAAALWTRRASEACRTETIGRRPDDG